MDRSSRAARAEEPELARSAVDADLTGRHTGNDPGVEDGYVSAAQGGDEDAFAALYLYVNPSLVRYLRVLVGADAEDVAAETWAQVCRDLPRFRGGMDSFRGWVTRIGRNRALDHVRTRQRRRTAPAAPEDLWGHACPTDVAREVEDELGTREALALVGTLPREQAEAVMLRVVLEFDAKTAGRIVGRSAGSVRTAAHRGLRALALLLEARTGSSSSGAVRNEAEGPS